MASYTSNLGMKKPALDDDALITDINNNMDILDAAVNGVQDGLAIVANGNTHVAITAGQFVYVRNHSTLTEGLYVASTNIAANATLSTSNLTADPSGGLNALNSKIAQQESANNYISDLNSATTDGFYRTDGSTANKPGTDTGVVMVKKRSTNDIIQVMFSASGVLFYTRATNNGGTTWESWYRYTGTTM